MRFTTTGQRWGPTITGSRSKPGLPGARRPLERSRSSAALAWTNLMRQVGFCCLEVGTEINQSPKASLGSAHAALLTGAFGRERGGRRPHCAVNGAPAQECNSAGESARIARGRKRRLHHPRRQSAEEGGWNSPTSHELHRDPHDSKRGVRRCHQVRLSEIAAAQIRRRRAGCAPDLWRGRIQPGMPSSVGAGPPNANAIGLIFAGLPNSSVRQRIGGRRCHRRDRNEAGVSRRHEFRG